MNKQDYIQKAVLLDGQPIAKVARSLNNCPTTINGTLHNACKKINKPLYEQGMKLKHNERGDRSVGWKYEKPSLEFLKKHAEVFMSPSNTTNEFCCPHCGKSIRVHST